MWNTPTKEELSKIPRLYETERIPLKDKIIHMHFSLVDAIGTYPILVFNDAHFLQTSGKSWKLGTTIGLQHLNIAINRP
jgi:hypothetical protein